MYPSNDINTPINLTTHKSLSLHSFERKLILVTLDIFLLCIALIIAVIIRTELLPNLTTVFNYSKWFVTLALVWGVWAAIFDSYNLARAASSTYSLSAVIPTIFLTSISYLFIPWLTPSLENRGQAFLFIILALLFITTWRFVYVHLFSHPAFRRRALVIGEASITEQFVSALETPFAKKDANPFRGTGYELIGFMPTSAPNQLTNLPIPPIQPTSDLSALIQKWRIDDIILSHEVSDVIPDPLYESLLTCQETGVPITNIHSVYERLTGRVSSHANGRIMMLLNSRQSSPSYRLFTLLKRMIDIIGALCGLLILLAVIPVITLLNALFSPGPLFYRQVRVGQGGVPFTIIKFRSMTTDAENGKAVWASSNDSRVTRVGQWLRRTHVDEIPQVINVLRGQMSLVGPRPERPEFVTLLSQKIPYYRMRHSVKPGVTGWAQVHQDYGDSIESTQTKLEYDLFYIKNASTILDSQIILRTIVKIFGLHGR
ncbi:MAG TPA: sugar transferase [Anaerolineae bacterium]|nr:sugar transferase [Anaerolineae bacterium]